MNVGEQKVIDWQKMVDYSKMCGFEKVTIISSVNYQTLGQTSVGDIATAWMDGNNQVNENQQLLDFKSGLKFIKTDNINTNKEDEDNCNVNGLPHFEMRFYGKKFIITSLLQTNIAKKMEYDKIKIAVYWCLLFQNNKNKMETFPKHIVVTIGKYAMLSNEVKCLIAERRYDEYLLVTHFDEKEVWFVTLFHTRKKFASMKCSRNEKEKFFQMLKLHLIHFVNLCGKHFL